MVETQVDFRKRLGALDRKHAGLANGYTTKVRNDGLIVVKPKRGRRSRVSVLRGLFVIAFGFVAFKAFMLASMGEITYNERVAKLNQGTVIEQGGAWVMQIDPATTFVAGFIDPFVS